MSSWRSPNPKTKKIPPILVTPGQLAEIDRRAQLALMTRAEYVRERALGRACHAAKQPDAPAAEPEPETPAE